MQVRNFFEERAVKEQAHGGLGEVKNVFLYREEDFTTTLRFIIYTEIEPGQSIGYHTHGDNEEVYVILDGSGQMTVDGETRQVKAGDVLVNRPGASHGLENNQENLLRILVFEAGREAG